MLLHKVHNPFVCCTCGTLDPELLPRVSAALDHIRIVQGVTSVWKIISLRWKHQGVLYMLQNLKYETLGKRKH